MKTKEHTEEIDIQKYWLILKRRCSVVAVVFLAVSGLTTLSAMRQRPSYEAVAKLLIKAERNELRTGLNVDIGELNALGSSQQKDPLMTQAETVKSIPIFKKAIQSVPPPNNQKALTPEYLLENLKIKAISGTDVLQISYQADDPKYATAIVNAVINEYIASNINANREEAAAARRFITSQLPRTEEAVRKAESALRQFKERDNVIALSQETSQAVSSIGNLDTQIDQARAAFADVNARSTELRRQLGVNPAAAVDLSALRKSSGVQEVLTKLQAAQSQLAVEQTRYQNTHPKVINLRQQVNSLNSLLDKRVVEVINRNQPIPIGKLQPDDLKQNLITSYLQSEVEMTGLSKRITELSALQKNYKERATTLPGLEKTQRELERQLKAAQTTYETLLAKLQEVQVAENQRVGNVRVVQPAIAPQKPTPSRKILIMAAGSIAGILLGVTAALVLDLLDQSVKTLEQVREQFNYTLLGIIPAYERSSKSLDKSVLDLERIVPRIMSRDRPHSIEQKAYRMLQSNLSFLSYDRALKSIVVTSSMQGEGKSEVSANLAVEIAQLGRRVLLVDTNMNHPSLHTIWDLPNTVGLSHVLVGKNKADNAIQEVMPNLYVLTTGGIVPDPMALLDSNRMETLVSEFLGRYDFVIFDAPSISTLADASILDRMADGIVLVARPGILKISIASETREKLASVKQKIFGIVVNGISVVKRKNNHIYDMNHHTMNRDRNYPIWEQAPLKSK